MFKVSIDPAVFIQVPSFRCAAVVTASTNIPRVHHDLTHRLRESIEALDEGATQASLSQWSDVYSHSGINPHEYPPPPHNVLKHIKMYVNALDELSVFEVIALLGSLDHLTSVTVDRSPQLGTEILFCFASGSETFVPAYDVSLSADPGRPYTEYPVVSEPIWVLPRTGEVLWRRWSSMPSERAKSSHSGGPVLIRIEALGKDSEVVATRTSSLVAAMIEEHCAAKVNTAVLTPSSPSYQFK